MTLSEKSCISRHLEETVIAYWHDVDFNWGRNAAAHYTEDAVFVSPRVRYEGGIRSANSTPGARSGASGSMCIWWPISI